VSLESGARQSSCLALNFTSWRSLQRRRDPVVLTTVLYRFRVFRVLPKAPLISWQQGYQYTLDVESRNHQIKPTVTSPSSFSKRDTLAPWGRVCTYPQPGTSDQVFSQDWVVLRSVLERKPERRRSRFDEPWRPMRSLSRILREPPSRQERFLPDASRSKGNQEAFRRGPRERPETPKQWNRSRCYRIHPYWTNNLKYVF
jgi:hypothetical protein